MKPAKEDRERSHSDWIETLHDSRLRCRQALMQSTIDVSNPEKALWPTKPPALMSDEHKTIAKSHAAILDYAEHVEPFKNRCSHLWTQSIHSDYVFPDGERLPIALADLHRWADLKYDLSTGGDHELKGESTDVKYYRVHIPTRYARLAHRQLNKCLDRLQLAVDLENPTFNTKEDDPGLTHGD